MVEPIASALFGAASDFENLAIDMEKVENLARLLATAQDLDEGTQLAFHGLSDLAASVRRKMKECEDKFRELSRQHRRPSEAAA